MCLRGRIVPTVFPGQKRPGGGDFLFFVSSSRMVKTTSWRKGESFNLKEKEGTGSVRFEQPHTSSAHLLTSPDKIILKTLLTSFSVNKKRREGVGGNYIQTFKNTVHKTNLLPFKKKLYVFLLPKSKTL